MTAKPYPIFAGAPANANGGGGVVQITDLVDLATLRELNCSLCDALGLEMALVDGHDTPLTASEDWGNGDTGSETVTIPVYVNGREAAQWRLRSRSQGVGDGNGNGQGYSGTRPLSPGGSSAAAGVLERPVAVRSDAIALVSLMSRMVTDYASANLGLLERVREHAAAALEATSVAVRAERLVDTSPNALVELDREGAVLWANKGAREMLDMEEFDSRGLAGLSGPWRVETLDGRPYEHAWLPLARRLVKGHTVSNVLCTLSRSPDRSLLLRLDVSPRLSESGRLIRVMCALGELAPPPARAEEPDRSRVWEETVQPLMHAWLELDGARQSLERGDSEIGGRLDTLACLLKEAVGSLNERRFMIER